MAEEDQVQESGQEQEQPQETEPAQEPEPAEQQQEEDKPAKEKKDNGGLLMPILYALLAATGAFTLVMVIGIVITFLTRPAQPSESPSAQPPSQSTPAPVQARQSPDGEGFSNEIPFSFL